MTVPVNGIVIVLLCVTDTVLYYLKIESLNEVVYFMKEIRFGSRWLSIHWDLLTNLFNLVQRKNITRSFQIKYTCMIRSRQYDLNYEHNHVSVNNTHYLFLPPAPRQINLAKTKELQMMITFFSFLL